MRWFCLPKFVNGIFFLLLCCLFMLAIPEANAQNNLLPAKIYPDSKECCSREFFEIIAAAKDPVISRSEVTVRIPQHSENSVNAETPPCPKRKDLSFHGCNIYITEGLLLLFTKDELLATLAHELGHLRDPSHEWPNALSRQIFADEFSMRIMKSMGKDPALMTTAFKKLMRTRVFYGEEDVANYYQRIRHMQQFLRILNEKN